MICPYDLMIYLPVRHSGYWVSQSSLRQFEESKTHWDFNRPIYRFKWEGNSIAADRITFLLVALIYLYSDCFTLRVALLRCVHLVVFTPCSVLWPLCNDRWSASASRLSDNIAAIWLMRYLERSSYSSPLCVRRVTGYFAAFSTGKLVWIESSRNAPEWSLKLLRLVAAILCIVRDGSSSSFSSARYFGFRFGSAQVAPKALNWVQVLRTALKEL